MKKILIVEDNELNMKLFNDLLETSGYETRQTREGLKAISIAKKFLPDLILMDIKMPVMGGYEATREIRKFNKNTYIIAQTAYALGGDMEKAINAGCNEYITKPIDSNKLLMMIKTHLIE